MVAIISQHTGQWRVATAGSGDVCFWLLAAIVADDLVDLYDDAQLRVESVEWRDSILVKSEEFPQPSALNPHPYIEMGVCCDMRGWGVDYGG